MWQPLPRFPDLNALNTWLEERCIAQWREIAGSYCIPVDGKYEQHFDWMNARSILLISDSCYSGGLALGIGTFPEDTSSEAHDRYLAKASRRVRCVCSKGPYFA